MKPDVEDSEPQPGAPRSLAKSLVQVTVPILVLIAGLELGALFFGDKSTQLNQDGVVTTAEIIDVSEDAVGALLEKRPTVGRRKTDHRKVSYRFTSRDGTEVDSSFSYECSENATDPEIGSKLEVRYSASDPNIHELTAGHTARQTSALHWIAVFFAALWLVLVFCLVLKPLMPRKLTTREKRLQRMKELHSEKRSPETSQG